MKKNILSFLTGLMILLGGSEMVFAQTESPLERGNTVQGQGMSENLPKRRTYSLNEALNIPAPEQTASSSETSEMLKEADRLYQAKRYNDAEKIYLSYVQPIGETVISSDVSLAWHRLALIAKMRQQIDKAQKYLVSAIKTDPVKNPRIAFDFAVILYDLEEYERAKNFFSYLVERVPDEIPEAQTYLGKTLLMIDPSADLLPLLEREYGRQEAGRVIAERCREVGKEEDAQRVEQLIFIEKVKDDQVFFADVPARPIPVEEPADAERMGSFAESFAIPAFSELSQETTAGIENPQGISQDISENTALTQSGTVQEGNLYAADPSLNDDSYAVSNGNVSSIDEGQSPSDFEIDPSEVPFPNEVEADSQMEYAADDQTDPSNLFVAPVPEGVDQEETVEVPVAWQQSDTRTPIVFPGLIMSEDEGNLVSEDEAPQAEELELAVSEEDSEEAVVTAGITENDKSEVNEYSVGGFDGYQLPVSSRELVQEGKDLPRNDTEEFDAGMEKSDDFSLDMVQNFDILPDEKPGAESDPKLVAANYPADEAAEEESYAVSVPQKLTSEEKLEQAQLAGAKITYLTPEEYNKEIATRAGRIVFNAKKAVSQSDSLTSLQKKEFLREINDL